MDKPAVVHAPPSPSPTSPCVLRARRVEAGGEREVVLQVALHLPQTPQAVSEEWLVLGSQVGRAGGVGGRVGGRFLLGWPGRQAGCGCALCNSQPATILLSFTPTLLRLGPLRPSAIICRTTHLAWQACVADCLLCWNRVHRPPSRALPLQSLCELRDRLFCVADSNLEAFEREVGAVFPTVLRRCLASDGVAGCSDSGVAGGEQRVWRCLSACSLLTPEQRAADAAAA